MSDTMQGVNVGGGVQREIGFKPGANFFLNHEGKVMFQIGLDASTIIGPNPMRKKDREEHMDAWFRFCDEHPEFDMRTGERKANAQYADVKVFDTSLSDAKLLTQLDHDHDGKPGGSLPEAELPEADEKAQIKARLLELGAGLPHPRSGLAKLRAALAEAEAEAKT